ncbi:GAF and ANTAR domain-containing protein [Cellulomonas shaoxiangyii]|uniref:ANTAR domain-containing protein n=1 Tax=Cellulomonas shaoxiangyii TaxID=2566013 RepID=A0A4P7SHL9_9CELL|nr:GAF and ANTAR domain-containing protein [Cellulomonas shaoxiangyii]QCB93709.1 ANTAR domain-containing protein [Cellulomonas shaoxiangyii]TGY86190.1 ANTAR domain-containing protein [Cellulomonas shaoxiangyii]
MGMQDVKDGRAARPAGARAAPDGAVAAAPEPRRLESAFVALAWLAASDLPERARLERLAHVVAGVLPPTASVGVALGAPWAPDAVVTTGLRASAADRVQIGAGYGPCASAWTHGTSVLVGDLGADPRWPRLATAAAREGVRSAIAVLVHADAGAVGVVGCYAAGTDVFDEEHVRTVELLASAAGATLTALRLRAHSDEVVGQLNRALTSRAVIDQAKGVVMAVRGGTADDAFAYLARVSQAQNVRLGLTARRVVEQARTGTLVLPEGPHG